MAEIGGSPVIVEEANSEEPENSKHVVVFVKRERSNDERENARTFSDLVQAKLQNFECTEQEYTGFVESEDRLDDFLKFLNCTGYYFYKRDCQTKKLDNQKKTFYFHWRSKGVDIPFFGAAFEVEHIGYYHCVHGENKSKKDEPPKVPLIRTRPTRKSSGSRKIGCRAKMVVKRVRVYPDYAVRGEKIWRQKKEVLTRLKRDVRARKPVTSCIRFYISLSTPEEHSHPLTMKGTRLHPVLTEEIHKLVKANVCSVESIRFRLQLLVEDMFAGCETKPDPSNTVFFPSNKTITNHIRFTQKKMHASKIDQNALRSAVEKWRSTSHGDHFVFNRLQGKTESGSLFTVIFCHQTKWQKHLLARYGNYICILDTVREDSIPLYFLIVKTNVDYCVVGTFLVTSKSKGAVSEALSMFLNWNPYWKPRYFVASFSKSEMCAIQSVFPGVKVYVSAIHREREWNRYFTKTGTAGPDSDELKELWHTIANSCTESEYQGCLKFLREHESWKRSGKARDYFRTQCLPAVERWVDAFFEEDFLVYLRMNNGAEELNKFLQHSFLDSFAEGTLNEMITAIVDQYLPDLYKRYSTVNETISPEFEHYSESIPEFLQNRPYHFIGHIMDRLTAAETFLGKIAHIADGVFSLQSISEDEMTYIASFNPIKCTCNDFTTWVYPCLHFCVIFMFVVGWGFDKLEETYRDSPFLTLDSDVANCEANDNLDATLLNGERPAIGVVAQDVMKEQDAVHQELQKAMNLTYLCQDLNLLADYKEALRQLNSKLEVMTSRLVAPSRNSGKRTHEVDNVTERPAKILREMC